jgi:uncharacterized protein
MAQAPLNIVQDIYDAFGRGDVPAILEVLSPEVDWVVAGRREDYPMFGAWKGREGALTFFQLLDENEQFIEFVPLSFHPSGDTVLAQGRAALTLTKTRKAVAYDWAHIWTVRDGQVTAFKEFYDTAQVAEAYRG